MLLQKGDLKLAIYRVKVEGTWYDVDVGDITKSPVTVHIDGEEFQVEIESAEQPEASPKQETPVRTPPPRTAPTPAPPPPARHQMFQPVEPADQGLILRENHWDMQ